ncbi:MAG TPA: HlyU family transcriptional regulator [Hyphomicrobiaceae bacterium]|nr:HlyU family transcriptional regulator [Hyphomicrobiaceae bacterium]
MSFWKSLFGGGSPTQPAGPTAREEYKGYVIEARPYPEGGQFQVAGTITREIGGERKEERFVRADRFATMEDAATVALNKARQIIDQNGDRLFRS